MPSLITTSKSFLEWAQSLPNVVIPAGLESDMQEAIAEAEAAEQSVEPTPPSGRGFPRETIWNGRGRRPD